MRRIIVWVLVLILVGGVLFGATKGLLYWRARQMVTEVILQSAEVADVSYEGLDVALDGRLTLTDVAVRPLEVPKPLHIGRLTLSGPGPAFYLFHGEWDQGGEPPEHLLVSFDDIEVGPENTLTDLFEQGQGLASSGKADGCGLNQGPDWDLLKALGMERLVIDFDTGYDYDKAKRRLDARFDMNVRGMESVSANVVLDDVVLEDLDKAPSRIPSLVSAELSMRIEPKFGEDYLAVCASRAGVSAEDYRQQQVADQLHELEVTGLRLGEGLQNAIETFYRDWGEVALQLDPKEPVAMMQLLFVPPDQLPEVLGLTLHINEDEVQDISVQWVGADVGGLQTLIEERKPQQAAPGPRYEYRYIRVPVSQLVQHLKKPVRLKLRDQPERDGILASVGKDTVAVDSRRHGGTLTAHVPVEDIISAEVRVVVPVESAAK